VSPVRKVVPGLGSGHVEMATLDIPQRCRCVWIVVTPGVGRACRSRLKITNSLCAYLREHRRMAAEAQEAAAEYWRLP
jgi:hypothetical protein